jgi:ubiquinone/menaquinone biosynthesis C-methylase UbiE
MLDQNFKKFTDQASIYAEASYWRDDEEYLAEKYFKKGKKILVLGCGAGRTLIPLFEKGLEITAIDIVPKMVEAAETRIKGLPIKILLMDAAKLDFKSESFDYVFFRFMASIIFTPIYLKA